MRKEDLLSQGLYTSKYRILHRKMYAFSFYLIAVLTLQLSSCLHGYKRHAVKAYL